MGYSQFFCQLLFYTNKKTKIRIAISKIKNNVSVNIYQHLKKGKTYLKKFFLVILRLLAKS